MLKRTEPKNPSKPARSGELQLGRAVEWPRTPEAAQLDRVPNPQSGTDYLVRSLIAFDALAKNQVAKDQLAKDKSQPRPR